MGTNYYHRTNICQHCNRYDNHHIGKASSGWTFGFHGERDSNLEYNPLGEIITSFQDWKNRLKKGGKIFDEYGEEISFQNFLKLVEQKRNAKNNHTIYCKGHEPIHAKEKCWLDFDGNSFCEGKFS